MLTSSDGLRWSAPVETGLSGLLPALFVGAPGFVIATDSWFRVSADGRAFSDIPTDSEAYGVTLRQLFAVEGRFEGHGLVFNPEQGEPVRLRSESSLAWRSEIWAEAFEPPLTLVPTDAGYLAANGWIRRIDGEYQVGHWPVVYESAACAVRLLVRGPGLHVAAGRDCLLVSDDGGRTWVDGVRAE